VGGTPFHVVVNQEIKTAQSVEVLLRLVVEQGARFNFINVSTAVNTVSKLASMHAKRVGKTPVGKMLREDAGFAKLIDLVRLHCGAFGEQAIGNVLNGLASLHADLGVTSVDDRLAEQLAEVVERVAHGMNGQGVANTLNALGKVEAAAGAMSPAGWAALARAAERTAPTMIGQGVASTLNALGKVDAAADAMSPAGWAALARAAERTAPTMNAQGVANTLASMANLPKAWAELSILAREHLEAITEKLAPEMTSEGRKMTLWACHRLGAKVPSALRK